MNRREVLATPAVGTAMLLAGCTDDGDGGDIGVVATDGVSADRRHGHISGGDPQLNLARRDEGTPA